MAGHAKRARHLRAHRRTRPRSRTVLTVLSTVSVFATTLGLVSSAHADPTPQEIEAQIDEAWRELAPVIEQHNATRIDLAEKREEADELADKIEPLQLKVDMALAEINEVTVYTFKGGEMSTLNALLTSGSPYTFADQLSVLDQFARARQQQIAKVVETKQEYEESKSKLDALVAELTELEEELAEKADEIDAEIDRLQDLRVEAYGESGGIGELRPEPCPTEYLGGSLGDVLTFACAQIGKSYSWGSAGPNSYDCSGLTLRAWAQAGVNLPHNAARQRESMPYVDRSDIRPGDLVFYYSNLSHVGVYVGGGYIVDASQPGVPVRMRKMDSGGPVHSIGRPG